MRQGKLKPKIFMRFHDSNWRLSGIFWRWAAIICALMAPTESLLAATQSRKIPIVPKWHRFERSFRSDTVYANPLQEATLTVNFISPLGETNPVAGFWDGGRSWRVRFAPSHAGRWTYQSACSDLANHGLQDQCGEFLCTSPIGENRFHQHGPVRVARDHRHLEHADGTPFFWLADTTWDGALVSEPKDWQAYALIRAAQQFTVVQWAVAPGEDARDQSAFGGFADSIAINPGFFQRLDAKVDVLSQAGLLSAMVPFSEMESARNDGLALADAEVALLARYVLARYGAEPVAWLLAIDGDRLEKKAARWKRFGPEIFGKQETGLVVLYCGQTQKLLEQFRDENWVDVFGFPTMTDVTDAALRKMLASPLFTDWQKEPTRPVIPFAPYENGLGASSGKRFAAADVRRAVYTSLLLAPPAGVSYGAHGIANWDASVDKNGSPKSPGANLALWQKAMFMPAAKQMTVVADLMNSTEFWRLRPEAKLIATQPGYSSPRRRIVAAGADDKKIAIVYVPEDRTLELDLDALPPSPNIAWLNASNGKNNPAVAVVGGRVCQFPTPEAGDWVLVMKSGKP